MEILPKKNHENFAKNTEFFKNKCKNKTFSLNVSFAGNPTCDRRGLNPLDFLSRFGIHSRSRAANLTLIITIYDLKPAHNRNKN